MMVSFVLSFFPRDVLDEILNLIESVSEGFPSYSQRIVPRRLFCFGSLVILDVARCYLWLFTLYSRPKAALLFWFFGDFRCGALLFMVILVIYKYKNG